ncbi:nicotinate-nucleotide--dimethylbenzimidazole phosphoribosyltransferase [Parasphingorhabdus cellanae]|uniref:Nicotinate-nucleotide--dimethylbenzimidazole phosphoribosyltransferase n=1 Tax=Parasphingorhabdus cellanae TaxID=2806553 RepID=A0ABX7T5E5_9SPHN|nr:nicotinate-nucleotide--dimethylbenzimidazole phosphoribosyltransferase [Parasphingorhabdus cellanae]QTD56761.1 nicotinate-nucleotide--dimethylbenzimidazole phosphoribosyltransferase [Parasphingorhabdus cellanae]
MTITPEYVAEYLDALAKPQGSMGRLEGLAIQLAVAQQVLPAHTNPRRIVLFAGDHGVVESGVSAWPSAVTTVMMETIIAKQATSTALAAAHMTDLRLVDVGSIKPAETGGQTSSFVNARLAAGTANLATGPAMTKEQFQAAWAAGEAEAKRAHDEGFVLLIAGEMGIGNTTPAACLTMLLADVDAETATGHGAGSDDAILSNKQDIVARAAERARHSLDDDPVAAIAAVAGFEIAAMAGFYAQGAAQASVLLLDGYVATSAALIAERLVPGTTEKMIAAHLSAEPGHRAALDHLGLEPLLEWDMRLGEGTGALTALPLLDSAAALLNDVAKLSDIMP